MSLGVDLISQYMNQGEACVSLLSLGKRKPPIRLETDLTHTIELYNNTCLSSALCVGYVN